MADDSDLSAEGTEAAEEADLREQLEAEVVKWNGIARERLSVAREARKRSEYDVQLLANRIALLKEEDSKTWKIIEDTRRRTREVQQKRQQLALSFREQDLARAARRVEEEASRQRNAERRARSQSAKRQALLTLETKKKEAATSMRLQSRERNRCAALESGRSCSTSSASAPRPSSSQPLRGRSGSGQDCVSRGQTPRAPTPRSRPQSSDSSRVNLEREEQQLLARLRFAAAASGGRPPRPPALEDASPTCVVRSARVSSDCAELKYRRGCFSARERSLSGGPSCD
eukprot:TRINITY_DN65807_c0_g1_i1.p1 TRINITY_DN65807_c0_g1~~TRINITY_DN65807_c0_g1_i1.p1  ORF type:complete len:287 (-),score=64.17 TRINITY_DN65807_c0_g1_i1:333-1193(-)